MRGCVRASYTENSQDKSAPVHRIIQFSTNVHLEGSFYLAKFQAIIFFFFCKIGDQRPCQSQRRACSQTTELVVNVT